MQAVVSKIASTYVLPSCHSSASWRRRHLHVRRLDIDYQFSAIPLTKMRMAPTNLPVNRNPNDQRYHRAVADIPFVAVVTTVSVPDGGTVLLGGIKRLSEGRNEFGVPLLSKVPYVESTVPKRRHWPRDRQLDDDGHATHHHPGRGRRTARHYRRRSGNLLVACRPLVGSLSAQYSVPSVLRSERMVPTALRSSSLPGATAASIFPRGWRTTRRPSAIKCGMPWRSCWWESRCRCEPRHGGMRPPGHFLSVRLSFRTALHPGHCWPQL